jgi:Cu/Ag efflux protein CusF
MSAHVIRFVTAGAVVLALSLAAGCTNQAGTGAPPSSGQTGATSSKEAQAPARKAHVFRGKVEKIDPATKTLIVNGEDVEGWMGGMTMAYAVDKEEVLARLAVGDQITATVYDGDFKTLYGVKVSAARPR